ncbi:hypothetical protein XBI1_2660003 [Xenorhabdus bovienii str. Intermedium]|uniref:Uncharacterized protein n=1 Tax=Xenorhabdus bovienii str. Intermedium TaxID=1379677 RepID=A0A077QJQ3_XENBV|nr:hypothetical protein XBI1_2660003 [Xenorhabdus bovienii str. Intermedium]
MKNVIEKQKPPPVIPYHRNSEVKVQRYLVAFYFYFWLW